TASHRVWGDRRGVAGARAMRSEYQSGAFKPTRQGQPFHPSSGDTRLSIAGVYILGIPCRPPAASLAGSETHCQARRPFSLTMLRASPYSTRRFSTVVTDARGSL